MLLQTPLADNTQDDDSSKGPSQRKDSMTLPPAEETERLLYNQSGTAATCGLRAAPAYVRPYPMATHGDIVSYGFDLKSCVFQLKSRAQSKASEDAPTEIFLPEYHFPPESMDVTVSSGRWTMDREGKGGVAIPVLKWWPSEGGEQTLRVKGTIKRQGLSMSDDADAGFLERCRESICMLM